MGNRRSNGEGTIRKRTKACWEGRISAEDKRINIYGKSKGDVRQKMEEIHTSILNGEYVDESDTTIEEWMNTWADCYTVKAKESTRSRYRQDIRNHIIPELGNIPIQELKPVTVQRFLVNCKDREGLAEKSLKNIYLVLNKAMTKAQKEGLIRKNPCSDVEIPSYEEPQKEMRPLKDSEIGVFLQFIQGSPYESLFYLALFTGMRESELIGLTWDEIDWENNSIHLIHQLVKTRGKGGKYVFTSLKNKQSRTFIIPASVVLVLKKVKTRQAEWKLRCGELYQNKNNLVFTNKIGENICCPTLYSHFKKIVRKMGLPEVRFHDLRHTYATIALQNGVDIKTVSNNLGHATVAFTMDKYAHVTITMQKDSAQKMESFISSL